MGESNDGWGYLAEQNSELAEAWDGYERLPEPGENAVLDAFCERKHISIPALLRLGAKLSGSNVLAFSYDRGIKFRDMMSGKMWSYLDSEYPHLKIVRAGADPTEAVIVCEGESDGARLADGYDVDVAIMPTGARNFPESMGRQLDGYKQVLMGLDKDAAGEDGCKKIAEYHNNTVRFPAPGAGDWADAADDDLPPLPEVTDPPVDLSSELFVPAGEMLEMEVPEISSWLEHAILPIGGQLLLHGWAKSFKSFLALDLLSRLAQGQDWCSFEPTEEPVKVGIVQFEITWPYYHQRITQLRENAPERDLFNENFLTMTPMKRPELVAGNRKHEDKILNGLIDNDIQIVLIDPIRRAIGLADLNAENEVRRMLHFFERIQDLGVTVVATHHDNKEGARAGGGGMVSMTGSGAFSGDADTIIDVELPKGHVENDPVRDLTFHLRNAPAIGSRSMEVQDGCRIVYDAAPTNSEPAEAEDLGEDATADTPSI